MTPPDCPLVLCLSRVVISVPCLALKATMTGIRAFRCCVFTFFQLILHQLWRATVYSALSG